MSAVCKPVGPNTARRQSFPAALLSRASLDGTDRALAEQLGLELLGRGKDGAGLGYKLVRLDVAVDAARRRDDRRHRRLRVRLEDRPSPRQTAHAHPKPGPGPGAWVRTIVSLQLASSSSPKSVMYRLIAS